MSAALPLRDVHLPDAPGLWPPAPGWWLVAAALLLLMAIPLLLWLRRRQRERTWQRQFDAELAVVDDDAARLAALLILLRRAAREQAPGNELLQGDAWLQAVDPRSTLSPPLRQLMVQGAYQPRIDADQLAALQRWARPRYLALLRERRR